MTFNLMVRNRQTIIVKNKHLCGEEDLTILEHDFPQEGSIGYDINKIQVANNEKNISRLTDYQR